MNGKGIMVINDTTCIDKNWCIVGHFEDDKLHNSEKGVAIFRDGRSYEGPLTFEGPIGNGTFFLPSNDLEKNAINPNITEESGYGLSGCFGGTWDDVIVSNGKLQRTKQTSAVLCLKDHIPVESIWSSVFTSFAKHVFGLDNIDELGDGAEIWNKIAINMGRARRKQLLEKAGFEDKFSDFDYESIARFCQEGHELTLSSETPEKSLNDTVDLKDNNLTLSDILNVVPEFGRTEIDDKDWRKLKEYLSNAFENKVHPLYHLYDILVNCFVGTYSQPEKDSFLCEVAKQELMAMIDRIYTSFIVRMFPALNNLNNDLNPLELMYPIVLTDTIYLSLLQLYVHQYRKLDELYRQKMLFFEGRTDEFIMQHMEYKEAYMLNNINFKQAVDLFTSIKEKRTPCKTMDIIRIVFNLLNTTLVENKKDGADALMPLTEILVVKANVPHFGAEISTLTGLMTFDGNIDYLITMLQAMYKHLLNVNLCMPEN
ncbi:alsin homolog [Ochlerotatus camptorhynchus]|uniref:alsin homolog n=1 Tax=Ochlerotatus camptorhynchus TaxID=644619 RepID=UPI0031DB9107